MAKIAGVTALEAQLRRIAASYKKKMDFEASVGYSAPYAIFVHENLEAHHENGQAKFLEEPARRMLPELSALFTELVERNVPLKKAAFTVMLALQAESQTLVPVKTGTLKASAFVRVA